ncbi:MAG: trigger factor, partial [Campylobacterales bacterium]|nr:trigger factor [Campylobacterales bacterium]
MEIKSNKINGANAEIEATISKKVIDANVEKIVKQLSKTANVQGFRKGKVPAAIIKKQYGDKIVQDAEAEALRAVLSTGLDEMKIENSSIIGEPNIVKFDKSDDKIDVTVKIAMRPSIDLGDYASLVKDFAKPEVSDAEVEERITKIAENQAELVEVGEDRALVSGDIANINFEGFVDGEAFAGGKAENFDLTLGSGQFIPGFEDQLVGAKKGDDVEVKVTFPAEYQAKDLAGKESVFKVTVNSIKAKAAVEINDDLAKKLLGNQEDASLESLKTQVKEVIENEKLSKLYNEDLKPALLETYVNEINFDLPEFVVDQEIDMAVNKKAASLSEDEIKELRENADKLEEFRNTFREDAEKSVKATFIIDQLAQAENVKVSEQEVMQT